MPEPHPQVDAFSELARRLEAFQASIRVPLATADLRAFAERVRQLPFEAERIGDAGWTLPMWATPAEISDILERAANEDIDSILIEYYEAHDGANYVQLKRNLQRNSVASWHELIQQCFLAYEARLHLVVVPAMLTVVEGAIAQAGGPDAWKGTDPKRTVTRLLAHAADDSLSQAIWSSIHRFVEHLFQAQPFDRAQPTRINRHWILHGRDVPLWDKADCLRLFQAADTIAA